MSFRNILKLSVSVLFIISCGDKNLVKEDEMKLEQYSQNYPVPEKEISVTSVHGYDLADEYAWMKSKEPLEDLRISEHIKKENEYTKAVLSLNSSLENKLYKEIISRIDESDVSLPVQKDDYFYYSRDVKGEQYPVYCRKFKSLDAEEEILLDLNQLAKGKQYLELGVYKVSPDHKYLAYSIDDEGGERYRLFIKYLSLGTHFAETFDNVDDLEWAEKDNTFFYTTVNESSRSDRVIRHVLGTKVTSDRIMYQENDDAFYVWIDKTKSRKYLLIGTASKNTSEYHYLKSDDPMGFFDLMEPRKKGIEYYPDHRGDSFYILTNADKAFNFKVMKVLESYPYKIKWETYIPHRTETYIDDIELFKDHIVVSELSDGKRMLRTLEYESLQGKEIKFSDECYNVYIESNPMFDTDKVRYVYESMTTPYSIVEYNMRTGEKKFLKQQKVLGGFDLTKYHSELVYASAGDGEKVPVSLVYRRDKFSHDGKNPMLLEAYGAYGDPSDPSFSVSRISLLDRGFVVGTAHVRGGLEKGKKWHEGGMLLNKKNSFTDFISCAEYLIEKKYCSGEKLIINGGSAGGMLIGAVLNERPELFKGAVLDVPFLDVINTMLDPTLPATVSEYDEWGDPNEKSYFDYMLSYCPYQNIKSQNYPDILVLAGLNDTRVSYWEPLKWVSRLRERKTDTNTVIINMNTAGHGGSSGRYDYYKEVAMKFAWVLKTAGIKD
ncbi:MAG: S9 family peptidase [Candidatus Delongbacteria bacterium]|nr:S9 family peptidase [Candidatus Delongbacteria bacterium]